MPLEQVILTKRNSRGETVRVAPATYADLVAVTIDGTTRSMSSVIGDLRLSSLEQSNTVSQALALAQNASTVANTASSTASTASNKATQASTKADQAKTQAESAETASTSAQQTANTAVSTANAASEKADANKGLIDALTTRFGVVTKINAGTVAPTYTCPDGELYLQYS